MNTYAVANLIYCLEVNWGTSWADQRDWPKSATWPGGCTSGSGVIKWRGNDDAACGLEGEDQTRGWAGRIFGDPNIVRAAMKIGRSLMRLFYYLNLLGSLQCDRDRSLCYKSCLILYIHNVPHFPFTISMTWISHLYFGYWESYIYAEGLSGVIIPPLVLVRHLGR